MKKISNKKIYIYILIVIMFICSAVTIALADREFTTQVWEGPEWFNVNNPITIKNLYVYYPDANAENRYAVGVWSWTSEDGHKGIAYCMQPHLHYANPGTYNFHYGSSSPHVDVDGNKYACWSGNIETQVAAYYVYGAPGWEILEPYVKDRFKATENAKYALSHIILSYGFNREAGVYSDWDLGAPSGFAEEAERIYWVIRNELGYNYIPEGFETVQIDIQNKQSIAIIPFIEYKGKLKLIKQPSY